MGTPVCRGAIDSEVGRVAAIKGTLGRGRGSRRGSTSRRAFVRRAVVVRTAISSNRITWATLAVSTATSGGPGGGVIERSRRRGGLARRAVPPMSGRVATASQGSRITTSPCCRGHAARTAARAPSVEVQSQGGIADLSGRIQGRASGDSGGRPISVATAV